jgi:hypothetical protein
MRDVSISRGSRGYCCVLSETVLFEEYRHGLAPKKCNVRPSSSLHPVSQAKWRFFSSRLTALFLATKTTNNPISLEAYTSHIPKTASSDVLDLEFLVAQSLNFEFVVWHAHRALWGIWLDIQVSVLWYLRLLDSRYLESPRCNRQSFAFHLRYCTQSRSCLPADGCRTYLFTFTNCPGRILHGNS